MNRYVGIAGVQMNVVDGQDNSEKMLQKLAAVARIFPWVDIVFFSELCVYGMDINFAAPIPNPFLDKFAAWAVKEKKWLIPGSFYERQGGRLFNTSVVISPEGDIVARYRKIFPWKPLEISDAGNEFCVFDIPGKGRFGVCICYDQWFPEMTRTLAWMGAEAVFCPTATFTSDRGQELILAQANAIMNQAYFLSLNGLEGGGIGRSIFVDPEGHVLQTSGEAEMILTETLDLDAVARIREHGTIGTSQLWKDLGSFKGTFPIYQNDLLTGEVFKKLGPQKLHNKIG